MFELNTGGRYIIMGNIKFAGEIKSIAIGMARTGKSLYQAQEDIKVLVIRKCGGTYYHKWGSAVQTIVEDVYNDAVRKQAPFFDSEGSIVWY